MLFVFTMQSACPRKIHTCNALIEEMAVLGIVLPAGL